MHSARIPRDIDATRITPLFSSNQAQSQADP